MTAQNKNTIKSYFMTGDKPTESQFANLIDSYIDTSAAGTVGTIILGTNTTAAAQNALGGGTVGIQIFQSNTTAAVQGLFGLGTLAFQSTVSATNIQNNAVTYAAITSAAIATTADIANQTAGKLLDATTYLPALTSALNFRKFFESTQQTITAGGLVTMAHGLPSVPKLVQPFLVCASASDTYLVNDEVPVNHHNNQSSTTNSKGQAIYYDATNVYVRFGNAGTSSYDLLTKGGGNSFNIVNSNWRFIVRAWG